MKHIFDFNRSVLAFGGMLEDFPTQLEQHFFNGDNLLTEIHRGLFACYGVFVLFVLETFEFQQSSFHIGPQDGPLGQGSPLRVGSFGKQGLFLELEGEASTFIFTPVVFWNSRSGKNVVFQGPNPTNTLRLGCLFIVFS